MVPRSLSSLTAGRGRKAPQRRGRCDVPSRLAHLLRLGDDADRAAARHFSNGTYDKAEAFQKLSVSYREMAKALHRMETPGGPAAAEQRKPSDPRGLK
jgi:hypothetical protein